MMSLLKSQVLFLKESIENGIISKDSPLIFEQKEKIIEILFDMHCNNGIEIPKPQLGVYVDKIFADTLGLE